MHITNFQHYLDKGGNIPTDMPKEARELANFLALLIDDASTNNGIKVIAPKMAITQVKMVVSIRISS